jgi:hypothetical protein
MKFTLAYAATVAALGRIVTLLRSVPTGAYLGAAELSAVGVALLVERSTVERAILAATVATSAAVGVRVGRHLQAHAIA